METDNKKGHFIESIIIKDIENNKNKGKVLTRFPPEPNGYLHIGHAKSICLNFNMANKFNGKCNLRFDDSNPAKEKQVYIDSIKSTVNWLGFEFGTPLFASDYFEKLHDFAVELIKKGKAYVCSLSADDIRKYRGTLKEPGKDSPYRKRSVEENLDLFTRMKNGEFDEGEHILRAKIDMKSPNINLRDPIIYRVKKASHPRTHDKWCIYPMYDFAHCLSDSLEGITHSLCSLEFEDHRPLYDWTLDEIKTPCHPQQIEFARMNINYTVLSKRKLQRLVEENLVQGWDDPRLPTLEGMKRRGYTPESIRNFCNTIGVSKKESRIDMTLLENCLRDDLNEKAPRVMAVLRPLKVTIENYPADRTEELTAKNHPQKEDMGTRNITFSKEIYVEMDDFMEDPPKKFFRLGPGREVRLRYAYLVTCTKVIKDSAGIIKELICTYDPDSRGGNAPDGRKVKGTIHWVNANDCIDAKVRLYDRLFKDENPEQGKQDFIENLNPDSLTELESCKLEKGLINAVPGNVYQFERLGYFCLDSKEDRKNNSVFNRAVSLRDTWAKRLKK
ncbi:MAG: glutamine--tRNA ligase/YqeY domain fusion protein [Desulfobacula sp.]|uniref:glutamine--tRNA ligase/YqeY domain fusion protein n=2 Tax=Desulfobacula sp. TaxID=2593537 RepID=UPI001DFDD20C|nr:glutamine--tRNA ligase/YqeY domain fusion protein [Desulfobacula sp.]MBT3484866.1 glutamine--tRNA ligase/YqeY domain fusion protein [Desulfobacula sp.]MBT3804664.1 glutamine--tRNA ligase/YqeY domain fusion protein [Desulfobacula sp.]MBT4024014.1 glutamine--tRNA ligase/YqeY domain fusion protein [Desulfobacula sp.]MBT4198376.1 glutamine--tRNA ligase/YqeY domain fusion protein [Desulfobacula sp.]